MALTSGDSNPSIPLLLSAGLFLASQYFMLHHLKQQGQQPQSSSNRRRKEENASDLDDSSNERHHKEMRRRNQRLRVRRHREQQQQQQQHHNNNQHPSDPSRFDPVIYDAAAADEYRRYNDDDGDEDEEDRGYQEEDDDPISSAQFREYYKQRRLGDRLSFENLRRPMLNEAGVRNHQRLSWDGGLIEGQSPPSLPSSPKRRPPPASMKTSSRRRQPSVLDREDENDFLPKNSNWNHFERHNEDDLTRGIVATSAADQKGYQHYHGHHYQAFSSGCMAQQEENEKSSTSTINLESTAVAAAAAGEIEEASSDASEEPQFVWTDAIHEKKRSISMAEMQQHAVVESMDESRRSVSMAEMHPNQTEAAPSSTGMKPTIDVGPPSLDENLPSPVRLVATDSTGTLMMDNTTCNKEQPQPAEQQRDFLRRASTRTSISQSEHDPLPQQFLPPSDDDDDRERRTSTESHWTAHSELSPSSHNDNDNGKSHGNRNGNSNTKNANTSNSSHRNARAQYNAKIMPNKVVMIRHGQSMGNIDETLYATTPDNAMPLTKLGWEQARKAGKHLKENVLADKQSVHFIVSPYARTVETFHGIVSAWCDPDGPEFMSITNRELRLKAWYEKLLEMGLTWHEDPRIREQDFGNYQDPELIRKAKRDRHRFGVFYYRFPHGESASDVFDRVSTFLDSLWRSFDMNRSRNYVLVTHGISVRVLLARYFRYTIHQFNMLANPSNCEMVMLGHDGYGRLRLQGRYQLLLKEKAEADLEKIKEEGKEVETIVEDAVNGRGSAKQEKENKTMEVDGYKFFKRLRILPQAAIQKVDIRISYNDGVSKDSPNGLH